MQNTCQKMVQVESRQVFDVNRLAPLCSAHSIPSEQLKHTKQKNNYSPNTRLTKHFLQIITLILAPDKFTNKFVSFSHQILCRYHLETKHYTWTTSGRLVPRAAFPLFRLQRIVWTYKVISVVLETPACSLDKKKLYKVCATALRHILPCSES